MNNNFTGVYIVGNERPTLYTGVSNNLIRRVLEHKQGRVKGFTQKYGLKKLLYYEFCENISGAIIREKQIKDLNRKDKLALINLKNPLMRDLSNEIFSFIDDLSFVETFDDL